LPGRHRYCCPPSRLPAQQAGTSVASQAGCLLGEQYFIFKPMIIKGKKYEETIAGLLFVLDIFPDPNPGGNWATSFLVFLGH
jgi:hypothetical protein